MTREFGTPDGSLEQPAIFFRDAAEFRGWLEANHDSAPDLWMALRKKHVANRGLTWEDAVPQALCFGWIDSKTEGIDDDTRRQRWTPRRPRSIWSAVNIAHVERLTAAGLMHPAGLAAYEARDRARTGLYSFEQGVMTELPEPYASALAADPIASRWWAAATPGYRKICIHWVISAKQHKTRDKRAAQLIVDSAAGRLIPSQRYGAEPAWCAKARNALGLPAPTPDAGT